MFINVKCRIHNAAAMASEVIENINIPQDDLLSAITKAVLECCSGSMSGIRDTAIEQILEQRFRQVNGNKVNSPMIFNNCRIGRSWITVQPLKVLSGYKEEHKSYRICTENSIDYNSVSNDSELELYKVGVTSRFVRFIRSAMNRISV